MHSWKFDKTVADRFQREAITNIPDYERVVNLCLSIAIKRNFYNRNIIDIGSALGYTVDKFIKAGFYSTTGVESSPDMINSKYCLHPERTIYSDTLPKNHTYAMAVANWTLHFVKNRESYIKDIYDNLDNDGVFILTDKTTQTDDVKEIYYDFKRSNGIDDAYIYEKEEKLKGYMVTETPEWYIDTLKQTGFSNIQIINSSLGFVTFYAQK